MWVDDMKRSIINIFVTERICSYMYAILCVSNFIPIMICVWSMESKVFDKSIHIAVIVCHQDLYILYQPIQIMPIQ